MLFVKPLILRKRNQKFIRSPDTVDEVELVEVNPHRRRDYNVFVEEKEEVS